MKHSYTITLVLLIFGNLFYNPVYTYGVGKCTPDSTYKPCTTILDKTNTTACESFILPIPLKNYKGGFNTNSVNGFFYISPYNNGTNYTLLTHCPGMWTSTIIPLPKNNLGPGHNMTCTVISKS